jgi:NAD(P)-dependent dehydrogenase (short-subunit alcohol dehydrogenase family)
MSTSPIDQKAVLITGGYSRLGKAISLGLANMGARVAVAGIEGVQAAEFAEGLRTTGCGETHDPAGTGGKQVHIGSVRTQLALRGRGYAACST